MGKNQIASIIIICAALLLIAGALGFSGFFNKLSEDKYSPEKKAAVTSVTPGKTVEEQAADNTPVHAENKQESSPVTPEPDASRKETIPSTTAEQKPGSDPPEKAPEQTEKKDNDDVIDAETLAIQLWLEQKIEEHKDEIEEKDLADFRVIVKKLDQPFIKKLSIDGFNGEEQELLKEHMNERLTESECKRAKELFFEYSFLLEDI